MCAVRVRSRRNWNILYGNPVAKLKLENTMLRSSKITEKHTSLILCFLTVSTIVLALPLSTPDVMHQQIHTQVSAMNREKAISLALGSREFQAKAVGHLIQFNSIFTTWSASSRGDSLGWQDVNVVYSYQDSTGSANIVVTMDPTLTRVVSVTTQDNPLQNRSPSPYCITACNCSPSPVTASGTGDQKIQPQCGGGGGGGGCVPASNLNPTWSGYEMRAACNERTVPIYYVNSQWTVPSVGEPWQHACDGYHCDVALWAGLTAYPGGSTYIVQAGTDSGVYCAFGGCSYFYTAWYEFYPQASVSCGAVNPGDLVLTQIENFGSYGTPADWNVFVSNYHQGGNGVAICNVQNYNFDVSTPYYAQFIAERPHICQGINCFVANYDARLPQFGSVTMSANLLQPNVPGYTAWSNGWYTIYRMQNTANQDCTGCNIGVSIVSSSNIFTQTWLTSANT